MKSVFVIMIFILFASFLCADWWTITDWSDSTTYDSILNLNGFRQPGSLILDAPDIWHWDNLFSLPSAQSVYDMVISQDTIIYAATGDQDGDVFQSSNFGETWDTTANILGAQWVYGLLSTSDSLLYAAIVKGGNYASYVARSSNPDSGWDMGDALKKSATDYEQGVYCVVEAENYLFCGTEGRITVSANIYISDKGQGNWTLKTEFNDNKVLCMYAFTPQLLLAGTGDSKGYVLRSSDAGENWIAVDTLNIAIETIIVRDDGVAFLGTSDGRVFVSQDSGLTWNSTSPIPGANEIKSLFIDDEGIIYAGANTVGNLAEVYFSEDNGLSWNTSGDITGRSNILSLLGFENGFLLAGTNIDASIFRAAYFQEGYLISKPFYTGTTNGSTKYGIIQWADSLNGQIVRVWVRTAKDDSMNSAPSWYSVFPPVANGDSINHNSAVNDGDSYIQYRVKLETQDMCITPFLNEISIEYSVDTLGPYPESAIAYDGVIQQNGIDDDDYVIITFNEPTNRCSIPKDTIDFILKLSDSTHTWGNIDSVYWSDEGVGNAIFLTVEVNQSCSLVVNTTVITPESDTTIIPPETVIKDVWDNNVRGHIKLTGTFDDEIPPVIISAIASDSIDSIQGIDNDDFVRLIFDQETISDSITSNNIDSVLRLSGSHTWGDIDTVIWDSSGETLTIHLDTTGNPTVEVGDTIFPDSLTIKDVNENPCFSPVVITGTFGDYGPVIDSAVAYDNIIDSIGIDSDDYVLLFFNKSVNAESSLIDSANIDSVLKLNIINKHTWNPIDTTKWIGFNNNILLVTFNPGGSIPTIEPGDTIYPDSVTIIDLLGQPCIHSVVLTGSFDPGVEESNPPNFPLPVQLNLSIYPNPSRNVVTISYDIPLEHSISKKSRTKIEAFDITGRKVTTILDKDILPGKYNITLQDKTVKQGIYFIKISSGSKTLTRKLIYLR